MGLVPLDLSPNVFNHLQRNVSLNQFPSVELRSIALSDHEGEAVMTLSDPSANNDGTGTLEAPHAEGPQHTVKPSTFDAEIGARNEPVKLIEIDAEGHEIGVLKGMQESLRKGLVQSLIVEIEHTRISSMISWRCCQGFRSIPCRPGASGSTHRN